MNKSRFDRICSNLNALALKVLEAVPLAEPWTSHQIQCELHRLHANTMDKTVLEGCLNTLVEAGIVKERNRGLFVRIKINEPGAVYPVPGHEDCPGCGICMDAMNAQRESEKGNSPGHDFAASFRDAFRSDTLTIKEQTMTTSAPAAGSDDFLSKFGKATENVRSLTGQLKTLTEALRKAADQLDEFALQGQAQIEAAEAHAAKFERLRELLKDA